ncbi:MAG: hemerythrin family protein, partial [Candidatus Scalindua sp.]|nr:hemerythrin family protein [Candidatus Scalindua sp.]
KSEEVMMRDSDYPYYEEHRQLHDDLISILNEQAGEVASDLEKLPAFRLFVADWITNHVKNVDQLLGEHLQS